MDAKAAISRTSQAGAIVSRISVPRRHESILTSPPLVESLLLTDQNSRRLSSCDLNLQGAALQTLRSNARGEILAEAVHYTSAMVGHDLEMPPPGPLIVTGHQPELFHVGVWAKNFATAGIARKAGGTALNLIIDNDTVTSTRMRIPVGPSAAPSIEWIPFDVARAQQPWEESSVIDGEMFSGFGRRVQSLVRKNWCYEPIISDFWPAAVKHLEVSRRLSDCLTAARVAAERSMGIHNLEIPMSRLCSTRSFCWFAAYLMRHLPRLHQIYNRAVHDYRRQHHIRSTTHPVPELETQDDWFEAPFWIWRRDDLRRERPFVRRSGTELELRDRRGWSVRLPVFTENSLESSADVLQDLQDQGLRFRTRALTTTLFARICLSDLFVHGIGGAKYDLMTDTICREFFEIEAPPFETVSATVHLPLSSAYPVTEQQIRELQHSIRDCKYNPDRRMTSIGDGESKTLITQKHQILEKISGRRPTRSEHIQLESINRRLSAQIEVIHRNLILEKEILQKQSAANSIFENREFSWCLHPGASIRAFMEREFLR